MGRMGAEFSGGRQVKVRVQMEVKIEVQVKVQVQIEESRLSVCVLYLLVSYLSSGGQAYIFVGWLARGASHVARLQGRSFC